MCVNKRLVINTSSLTFIDNVSMLSIDKKHVNRKRDNNKKRSHEPALSQPAFNMTWLLLKTVSSDKILLSKKTINQANSLKK